jgi:hypothetical protein
MPDLLKSYRDRVQAADNLNDALPFLILLGNINAENSVAAGNPRTDLASEVLRLIEAEQARSTVSTSNLEEIVLSLWPDWNPTDKLRVEQAMRRLYQKYLSDNERLGWVGPLASLLEQLKIVLPVEETKEPLERLLHKSQLPCEALAPLVTNDTLSLVVEKAFRYPVCPLGISPTVIEKLERLGVLRVEAVGGRDDGGPILERNKLAAWARGKGYNLEGSLPFKGVTY